MITVSASKKEQVEIDNLELDGSPAQPLTSETVWAKNVIISANYENTSASYLTNQDGSIKLALPYTLSASENKLLDLSTLYVTGADDDFVNFVYFAAS